MHVGGRMQIDGVWLHQVDADDLTGAGGLGEEDSVNFRRARLRADGTMYEFYDWVAEFDFVNSGNVDPTLGATENNVFGLAFPVEVHATVRSLPGLHNVRAGLQKKPIGMEHMTSSRFLEFMERSYLQDAFTGAFNNGLQPGISAFDTYSDERGT